MKLINKKKVIVLYKKVALGIFENETNKTHDYYYWNKHVLHKN